MLVFLCVKSTYHHLRAALGKVNMSRIILFNKPFQVLCQFTDSQSRETLAKFIPIKNIYPCGRLDRDSEGLLILSDDGKFQHQLSHPKNKTPKTYWVQVEGIPHQDSLDNLRQGVMLNDGLSAPAKVTLIKQPEVWERMPPVRFRKTVDDCWLEIAITEGRNRQLRRMTAAVGHPTLRLIRYAIGDWTIDNLSPGQWHSVE